MKVLRELARTSVTADRPVFQLVTASQQGNPPPDASLRRIRETNGSLYELLNRYSGPDKTDIFRRSQVDALALPPRHVGATCPSAASEEPPPLPEMVGYADRRKKELAAARHRPKAAWHTHRFSALLTLMRHGQTEDNTAGRWSGWHVNRSMRPRLCQRGSASSSFRAVSIPRSIAAAANQLAASRMRSCD